MAEKAVWTILVAGHGQRVPAKAIETVLSRHGEWARMTTEHWFLFGAIQDLEAFYKELKSVIEDSDHIMVAKLVPGQYRGWVSGVLADWFEEKFANIAKLTGSPG